MNDITLAAFVELALGQSAAGLFVVFIYALLKGWLVVGDQLHVQPRLHRLALRIGRHVERAIS